MACVTIIIFFIHYLLLHYCFISYRAYLTPSKQSFRLSIRYNPITQQTDITMDDGGGYRCHANNSISESDLQMNYDIRLQCKHTFIYYVSISTLLCTFIHISIYTFIVIYYNIYIYMYIYKYIYIYIFIHIYIYIYIYIYLYNK